MTDSSPSKNHIATLCLALRKHARLSVQERESIADEFDRLQQDLARYRSSHDVLNIVIDTQKDKIQQLEMAERLNVETVANRTQRIDFLERVIESVADGLAGVRNASDEDAVEVLRDALDGRSPQPPSDAHRDALEAIIAEHDGYCEHHVNVSQHSYNLAAIARNALTKASPLSPEEEAERDWQHAERVFGATPPDEKADAPYRCASCGLEWSSDSVWCPKCTKRRTAPEKPATRTCPDGPHTGDQCMTVETVATLHHCNICGGEVDLSNATKPTEKVGRGPKFKQTDAPDDGPMRGVAEAKPSCDACDKPGEHCSNQYGICSRTDRCRHNMPAKSCDVCWATE